MTCGQSPRNTSMMTMFLNRTVIKKEEKMEKKEEKKPEDIKKEEKDEDEPKPGPTNRSRVTKSGERSLPTSPGEGRAWREALAGGGRGPREPARACARPGRLRLPGTGSLEKQQDLGVARLVGVAADIAHLEGLRSVIYGHWRLGDQA